MKKIKLLWIRFQIAVILKRYHKRIKTRKTLTKVSSKLTILYLKEYDLIRGQ